MEKIMSKADERIHQLLQFLYGSQQGEIFKKYRPAI
jgi:hypothetical protein